MKKIYLFLVAVLGIFMASAQSIDLLYHDEVIEGNELAITLDMDQPMRIDYIHIQNKANTELNFRVEMDKSGVSEGNDVMMCFNGTCMTETVSTPVLIDPEETYEGFDLQYLYANGVTSTVVVKFIDHNTNEVLKTLNVIYQVQSSLTSQNSKNVKLSLNAQPNPAMSATNVAYSIPANFRNAKLVVRNSLGSTVKEVNLKVGSASKVSLNVSDLVNGVYFYSITADGRPLVTKKLIVKH